MVERSLLSMTMQAGSASSGRAVLIVEDDASLQRLLRMAFASSGFRVVEAYTGREALQQIETERPDAVVLDLGLPDKRGGEVLHRLRDEGTETPWLVISAMDRQEIRRLYGNLGDRLIAKPFDPWMLIGRVERLVLEGS